MSRIGKLPINIPAGVNVDIVKNNIKISSTKGSLSLDVQKFILLKKDNESIIVSIQDDKDILQKSSWGLTRTLINNMIKGVVDGYEKSLEIQGVGYKFEVVSKDKLILSIGLSHKVEMLAPEGVNIEVDPNNKNIIFIKGINKQAVGMFTAKIRDLKLPEPYKGKGIRYVGEYVRRKAGKTGAKK